MTSLTPEMIRAGGDCLDEYVRWGEGLENSPDYVAEQVYLAMEKVRPKAIGMQALVQPELDEWPRLRGAAERRKLEFEQESHLHPALRLFRGFLRRTWNNFRWLNPSHFG